MFNIEQPAALSGPTLEAWRVAATGGTAPAIALKRLAELSCVTAEMARMRNDIHVARMNVRRFQNLLDTSVDADERRTIQRLLTEEMARADEPAPAPQTK